MNKRLRELAARTSKKDVPKYDSVKEMYAKWDAIRDHLFARAKFGSDLVRQYYDDLQQNEHPTEKGMKYSYLKYGSWLPVLEIWAIHDNIVFSNKGDRITDGDLATIVNRVANGTKVVKGEYESQVHGNVTFYRIEY